MEEAPPSPSGLGGSNTKLRGRVISGWKGLWK